tara:strand:- start:129 stop:434 length:306 start_codon:yes stop_codon:yes gene_type:complete
MKFFKNAVYVLFFVSLANLSTTVYLYNEILKKERSFSVDITVPQELRELPLHSRLRDSQIMQAILMSHHQLGIHEPGTQPMCPMCQEKNLKTVQNKVIINE